MKPGHIVKIVKVFLDDVLLELHIYTKCKGTEHLYKLSITDDGETCYFSHNNNWTDLKIQALKTYIFSSVNSGDRDHLSKLLGKEIQDIQFGVGKTLENESNALYYIKVNTDQNVLLFFNNGDNAMYSLDKVEEILFNDTYSFEWYNKYPTIIT